MLPRRWAGHLGLLRSHSGILQLYSSRAGGEAAGEGSRLKARARCGAGMGGFWGAKPQKPCSSPGTADTHVAAM